MDIQFSVIIGARERDEPQRRHYMLCVQVPVTVRDLVGASLPSLPEASQW